MKRTFYAGVHFCEDFFQWKANNHRVDTKNIAIMLFLMRKMSKNGVLEHRMSTQTLGLFCLQPV